MLNLQVLPVRFPEVGVVDAGCFTKVGQVLKKTSLVVLTHQSLSFEITRAETGAKKWHRVLAL